MGRFCHSFLLAVRVHFTLSGRVTHRDLGSPHSTGKGPQNHARGVTHLSRCPCRAFFQGSKGQLRVAEQGKCKQTQRSRIWSGRLHFPRDGQQGWDSAGFTSWHSKATQALLESGRGMARATSDNTWLPNSCFSLPWGQRSRLHLPSSPTPRPSLEIQGLD